MQAIWQGLGANLAVTALIFSVWVNCAGWIISKPKWARVTAFTAIMGAAMLTTMALAVPLIPGVIFDLRTAILLCVGFFGSPVAALVTAGVGIAYRVGIGGPGVFVAVPFMGLTVLIGIVAGAFRRERCDVLQLLLLAAAGVVLTTLGLSLLPPAISRAAIEGVALPFAVLNFTAVLAGGFVLAKTNRDINHSLIFAAAFRQAPDYFYIKDRAGRFVAVNDQVALINGFSTPEAMIGLTDRDLAPDRATLLQEDEQQVMATGLPQLNIEETLQLEGGPVIYSTTKFALRDPDGKVIGLAGRTRDVTEKRQLESEVYRTKRLLELVMDSMTDGLALFDTEARLVFCNDRYRSLFPLTGEKRVAGANLMDILKAVRATGEQRNIASNDQNWEQKVVDGLKLGGDQQIEMSDGRWLMIRTTPLADGSAVIVVWDVTNLKAEESGLRDRNAELQHMATTDALTGLQNRRAFDDFLALELDRTEEAGLPLSLLMCDLDLFKAYNDTFGHQAGDECLQSVARAFQSAVRGSDGVFRYGGEELAAVLPSADETTAYSVAERFRRALADAGIEHPTSKTGTVTVSIGIATYKAHKRNRSAPELISRADEALYGAKLAGRNSVLGWKDRSIRPSALG